MLACSNFRLSEQKDNSYKYKAARVSALGMSAGAKGDNNEGMDSFRAYGVPETDQTLRVQQNCLYKSP